MKRVLILGVSVCECVWADRGLRGGGTLMRDVVLTSCGTCEQTTAHQLAPLSHDTSHRVVVCSLYSSGHASKAGCVRCGVCAGSWLVEAEDLPGLSLDGFVLYMNVHATCRAYKS